LFFTPLGAAGEPLEGLNAALGWVKAAFEVKKEIQGSARALAQSAPGNVQTTLETIDRTGSAPAGLKGGRTFLNDGRGAGQVLPKQRQAAMPLRTGNGM
jgi:hypothetical protein